MSNVPANLNYTDDHEWARIEADGTWTVGLTDYAQQQLGDIVFVDVPVVGKTVEKGDAVGTVESVKSVSEIFAPVSGKVIEVNEDLSSEPEDINTDPYETWIFRIKPEASASSHTLLDAAAYSKLIGG